MLARGRLPLLPLPEWSGGGGECNQTTKRGNMQTITTKHLPATDTKPSRVKATHSGRRQSVTVSCGGQDAPFYDRIAVQFLMEKLGWTGSMVGGGMADGSMVWVFESKHGSPTVEALLWDEQAV